MKVSDFYTVTRKEGCITDIAINWDFIWSIPEMAMLKETRQSPKWHAEGEFVSDHVVNVVNHMVDSVIKSGCGDDTMNRLLLSAIFHDIGKCSTTSFSEKDGLWHHYGHEIVSETLTRRILWDLGYELREPVCQLVRWHMEPMNIMRSKKKIEKMFELSLKVSSLFELGVLKTCDCLGSVSADKNLTENDLSIIWLFQKIALSLGCAFNPSKSVGFIRDYYHIVSEKQALMVYVYMGLPGAGKDTLIKKALHSGYFSDDAVVICRDDIRCDLGYCERGQKYLGNKEEEDAVTVEFNRRLLEAAKSGRTIILNNMHNKRRYRDSYKELLKNYNVYWRYIYVEADSLQTNIDRRSGQIPSDVFENIVANFEFPTPVEYDTLEIVHT